MKTNETQKGNKGGAAAAPVTTAVAAPAAPVTAPVVTAPAAPKKDKIPHLVCLITGRERLTTREYLDAKLIKKGITQDQFTSNYVCKDAMKLLRAGKTIDEIRTTLGTNTQAKISADQLALVMKFNGKEPKKALAKPTPPAAPVMAIEPKAAPVAA